MTASRNSGMIQKIVGWFIAALAVMGLAFAAAPHASAATVNNDGRAVVESGDNLTQIARELLGDASRWREIAELNNINNPALITPGQELILPQTEDGGNAENTNNQEQANPNQDNFVELCHRTGSSTNPYVRLRINQNAVSAHLAHGDIQVDANENCPTETNGDNGDDNGNDDGNDDDDDDNGNGDDTDNQVVYVCHQTGSAANPYVRLQINRSALAAHLGHGDVQVAANFDCDTLVDDDEDDTVFVCRPTNGSYTRLEVDVDNVRSGDIIVTENFDCSTLVDDDEENEIFVCRPTNGSYTKLQIDEEDAQQGDIVVSEDFNCSTLVDDDEDDTVFVCRPTNGSYTRLEVDVDDIAQGDVVVTSTFNCATLIDDDDNGGTVTPPPATDDDGGTIVIGDDDEGPTTIIIDDAETTDDDGFDLFSLLLLSELFDGDNVCDPSDSSNTTDLFDLFILSELFDDEDEDIIDTDDDSNFDSLFQLLILDELILSDNAGCQPVEEEMTCDQNSRLIDLFIISELFSN